MMAATNDQDVTDRISAVFRGKKILLTGGTGFMGKVFVEKILRVCPDIDCFYLLVRTKKGKNPQERLREVYAGPVRVINQFSKILHPLFTNNNPVLSAQTIIIIFKL